CAPAGAVALDAGHRLARRRYRDRLAALRPRCRAGAGTDGGLSAAGVGDSGRRPVADGRSPTGGGVMTEKRRHGLVVVITGDGKGKTTSALGLLFRALGQGFRIFMVQYIKGKWKTGEKKLADLLRSHADHLGLDVEIRPMGDGFTWITQNREQD